MKKQIFLLNQMKKNMKKNASNNNINKDKNIFKFRGNNFIENGQE